MNKKQRTAVAAKVIQAHRSNRLPGAANCVCGKDWNPLHVAKALDEAGLLCSLVEETEAEAILHQSFESIRAIKAARDKYFPGGKIA